MTGPGDQMAAGTPGYGRLRASHADREQAIGVLKDAFVQGLLGKDEFDRRVGRAFGSRTYAELAAVTAGIATALPGAGPGPARPLAGRAGACVIEGPGHAHRRAAARGCPACGAGLDHRAARPAGQGAGPGWGPAAVPVRCPGPGRDHLAGVPRRAAGGLHEPVRRSRAGPQAGVTAGRHRGRPGQDRRGLHTGPRPAARPGQDRRAGGRVLRRRKVARHFTAEITDDSIGYARDQDSIAAEAKLDGIYVLRTSVSSGDVDSGAVVSSYKALAQVERAFRAFNTDLDIRPIRHRTEDRVRPSEEERGRPARAPAARSRAQGTEKREKDRPGRGDTTP